MPSYTDNVLAFIEANKTVPVQRGYAHEGGGATYTLKGGKRFVFTLAECRSIPVRINWDLP